MSAADDHWPRVKELVADLLDAEGSRRAALEAALDDEPVEVAERVRALVAAASGDEAASIEAADPDLALGGARRDWTAERVGGFAIERFVARGGMGEVYEARQEGTGRRVAIKLLHGGSARELQRFQLEGRLLGRLEHPNIASVIEADVHRTDDGARWPYLALEFVDGAPITTAAREAGLDRDSILRLFVQLCRGVEHAHRRGVVHRDLKPDNVLVVPDPEGQGPGTPMILDFGIAALVADEWNELDTRLTRAGDLVGTLAYMAPEQVAGGGEVDARTDVHALGALLYELLTRRQPFELAGLSLTESLSLLRDSEAPLASEVDRTLSGDLDTILRTALAREPGRRYPSARALADDVERHLAHEPVAARPPGALYVTRKFVRRHRVLVSATVGTVLLLALGLVGTGIGLRTAMAEADHSARVNDFLGEILSAPNPYQLGRDVGFAEVFDHFAPQVDERFPDRPDTRASLHSKIGWAYSGLGEGERAIEQLELAAADYADYLGETHVATLRTIRELHNLRLLYEEQWPAAVEATTAHAALCLRELGRLHEDTLLALSNQGLAHAGAGEPERAVELLEQALAGGREAVSEGLEPEILETLLNNLGATLNQYGYAVAALEVVQEQHARHLERLGPDHVETLRSELNLALTLSSVGQAEEALAICEALVPRYLELFGEEHPDYGALRRTRGLTLMELGRYEQALPDMERASAQADVQNGELHEDALITLNNLCVLYANLGRFEDCARRAQELAARCDRADDSDGVGLGAKSLLAAMQSELGEVDAASDTFAALVADYEEVFGHEHPQTLIAVNNLAHHLRTRCDEPARAVPLFERAVAGWREALPDDTSTIRRLHWNLGRAQLEAGAVEAARTTLDTVEALAADDPAGVVPEDEWTDVLARLTAAELDQ